MPGPVLEPGGAGADRTIATMLGIVHEAVANGTWPRLRACRRDTCKFAYYDRSKNGSRAWCSMTSAACKVIARKHSEGARVIAHFDIDAFYASVAVRDDPSLRGKPLAIAVARPPFGGIDRFVRSAPVRRSLRDAALQSAFRLRGPRRRAAGYGEVQSRLPRGLHDLRTARTSGRGVIDGRSVHRLRPDGSRTGARTGANDPRRSLRRDAAHRERRRRDRKNDCEDRFGFLQAERVDGDRAGRRSGVSGTDAGRPVVGDRPQNATALAEPRRRDDRPSRRARRRRATRTLRILG